MCVEEVSSLFSSGAPEAAAQATDYGLGSAADYLMGTPTSEAWSAMPTFSDYGGGVAADYLMGTPGAGAYQGVSQTPSSVVSGAGGGGGGFMQTAKDVGSAVKPFIGPALGLGASMYGANSQNKMAQNLNQAQQASYDQYLNALNPPEPVKNAQYQKAVNQILPTASLNQRKIYNELASRGVRGTGLASPTAGMERDVTKAKQNAYLDIYGRYNIPQVQPPVAYTPGTSNLIGANVGDVGTALLLKQLFG